MMKSKRSKNKTKALPAGKLWWGRIWRTTALITVMAAVVSIGLFVQAASDDWSLPVIKMVKVESRFEQVEAVRVRQIIAPYAASNFFEVEVDKMKSALEAEPWVKSASVRRIWPDGLRVSVVEQMAVVRWSTNGLVNVSGDIFYVSLDEGDPLMQLPVISGEPAQSGALLRSFDDMNELVGAHGLAIVALHRDERQAWELVLNNGMRLVLGRKETQQRLQRFIHFYQTIAVAMGEESSVVDLRYGNGFVIS